MKPLSNPTKNEAVEVDMPEDWNDGEGWERHYASLFPNGNYRNHRREGSFSLPRLPDFASNALQSGWKNVWIPGCGFSPLPKVLAYLGLNVHATDISPTVIAYQESASSDGKFPPPPTLLQEPGSLTCAVHDFRQPYCKNHFDIIMNVKAIQGFPDETIRQVAQVHCHALKGGRVAYFDTMNVQDERRDTLETALVDAGFFVPYYRLNLLYRQKLRDTGLPYLMILGRPMIPMTGVYTNNEAKRRDDMAILQAISAEFQAKMQAEYESGPKELDDEIKLAEVIYSTG